MRAKTDSASDNAEVKPLSNNGVCELSGNWTVTGLGPLSQHFKKIKWQNKSQTIELVGAAISEMDSAGAVLLDDLKKQLETKHIQVKLSGFKPQHQVLIEMASAHEIKRPAEKKEPKLTWLAIIGKKVVDSVEELPSVLDFIGEVSIKLFEVIRDPAKLYWGIFLRTLQTAGCNALSIIALLSFLIGIVLAYQAGVQLREYGANIFVVDLVGISVLREFGPLITAIILAGRTGSAFAAQIGSMMINSEVDALQTMGVSPASLLIIPKVLAMLIIVPLLIVWSDIFGVIGGMVMVRPMLGIGYNTFMHRFTESVSLTDYNVGLVKAPVFALIITLVGCYQGFQVRLSADSVGDRTTRSVVQSLFMIIVADAAFSIYFSWRGI